MRKTVNGRTFALAYNGEIYNTQALRTALTAKDIVWETHCDTEVLLAGLTDEGADFIAKVNGIFAFAFWDGESLLLARDRLGVKPIFYALQGDTLYFGSEIKALFAAGLKAKIDDNSLRELFALGPAHTPGNGIFAGVRELLPGTWLRMNGGGVTTGTYWELLSRPHTDSYEETVEHTRFLLLDATRRQMVSDVPICTFLSGGLDSSLISAICAEKLAQEGKQLATFSFDFVGNDAHYKPNSFQPERDAPFAREMSAYLNTKHTELECDSKDLADLLDDAMLCRDYPGMTDVDASLLFFCRVVGKEYKVALTGETADEIALI
jgi:asparagine synthase (glutamine-hydrolysing)